VIQAPATPKKASIVRISEIEVGNEPERFSTGVGGLDACLAESEDGPPGLLPGTSVLISGMPGGGKSTITTHMLAAQHGRESVFFHGEERAERVKARWKRLEMKGADPYVIALKHGEHVLEAITDINAREEGGGIGLAVIDSVSSLFWRGSRKYDQQYEACEAIEGMIKATGGCVVYIAHVDKTGKNAKGSADLAHLVDIHLHLTSNTKKSERMLEVRKNRVGRAGFQVPVNILQKGISVGVPAPLTPGSGLGQARTALERTRDTAYALLLEGKHVTGYTVFELPPDQLGVTNGNMWRAGLEMAVQTLIREGFSLLQEKVNGRKGWRVENPPAKTEGGIVVVTKKLKLDEGGSIVDASKPSAPAGSQIVANGDAKPAVQNPKTKFPLEVTPGMPNLELD
jgi:KaiC/GvpD/RAD55 family RecA-like ATPase